MPPTTDRLPTMPAGATLDQIADFLQLYASLEPDTLVALIGERWPHLRFDTASTPAGVRADKYAIVTGWLRGEMDIAATALRAYVVDREITALGGAA